MELLSSVVFSVSIRKLPAHFYSSQSKLVSHEREYHQLKEGTGLLELAIWKSKINQAISNSGQSDQTEDHSAATKGQCHVNCGADDIIQNIQPFLTDS